MNPRGENTVAGVDGAKGEWVVALLSADRLSWHLCPTVDDVLALTDRCVAVGVDMPLSLPEFGYRASEVDAKAFLGTARSSIFHTPVRAVLTAPDYTRACEISRSVTGKAISKQTWNILPSVKAWQGVRFDADRYVEVHPECSFRTMRTETIFASKKTGRGVGQRLDALALSVGSMPLADLPPGPAIDDYLDAAAAAWSARRYSRGQHRVFGSTDHSDRIVA